DRAQVGAYESMLEAVDDYLGPEPTNMLASLRDNEEYVHLHELIHEIANRMITTEFDPYTGQEVEDLSLPVDEAEWRSAYLPVKDALTEIGPARRPGVRRCSARTPTSLCSSRCSARSGLPRSPRPCWSTPPGRRNGSSTVSYSCATRPRSWRTSACLR